MKVFIDKFFGRYRFNSILFVNFLKIFLVMFIILCISCITIYSIVMRISKSEMLLYNKIGAQNMIETTENVLEEIKNLTANIAIDTEVRSYITSKNTDAMIEGYQTRLITKLSSYKNMTQYIDSIYLYNESNDMIISHLEEEEKNKFEDKSWIDIYKDNDESSIYIVPNKVNGHYPYVLTYVFPIAGKGCVVVSGDIYKIAQNANSAYNKKSKLYITDMNNVVMYSNEESNFMTQINQELLDKILLDNDGIFEWEDNTYYGYFVEENGRKYIVTTLMNEYNKQIRHTSIFLIAVMIFVFFVGTVISLILAMKSFEPISKLMYFVDETDSNKMLEEFKNNEAKYIATKILAYIDSNAALKQELDMRMREHKELNLMAMQMQINPHFLNNSLNILGLKLAKEIGAENSSTVMVTSLSRLIQYVLNGDTIFVDFRQELSFLKLYVDFLKIRYNNLNVIWDIDAEVYDCKIMRVCLQPIVENAVYHGLSDIDGEKILKISAIRKNGSLIIAVVDNGSGMNAEKLSEVIAQMQSSEITSKHIGIKNVYRRLKIVYEDSAEIKIESEVNKYTRVTVTISEETQTGK